MPETNQDSDTGSQKSGKTLSEPDVNDKFTPEGGADLFADLDPGKASGHDIGTGSLSEKGRPFKLGK